MIFFKTGVGAISLPHTAPVEAHQCKKVRDVTWGSKGKQKLLPPDTAVANGSSCMYKWHEIENEAFHSKPL